MDMDKPIETDKTDSREPLALTLLGQALVLGFLVFMVMGLVKLGMVWFG